MNSYKKSFQVGELTLSTPLVIASCPATEDKERLLQCAEAGAEAAILKSCHPVGQFPSDHGPRRFQATTRGLWGTSSITRELLDPEAICGLLDEVGSRSSLRAIPSVAGFTLDSSPWIETLRLLEPLRPCCVQLDLFYIEEDLSLPINQERLRRLILDLRKDSQLALLPKLNQELRPGAALQSLNDTGIAGWSLLDSLRTHLPPAGTDKYDYPTFQYAERPEAASLFGSWQLPLVCDYVSRLRANSSLPILAGGGVNSAYDIIRLLALGADAIQVASAILRDGPGWIRRTLTELNSYHPEKAAPKTPENIQCAKAVIQRGLCSSCGRCTRQLMCQAITMKQDGPHITPDACEGCGFCLSVCPEGAIVLHSIPDSR